VFALLIGIALLLVIGLWLFVSSPAPVITVSRPPAAQQPSPPVAVKAPATLVDEATCLGCHGAQVKDWQGSHHQLAMQPATADTVLANFNDVAFKDPNASPETTRFFRSDNEFWINTTGLDGKAADFKVAYTFGVAPLQQYLIEVTGGRLQALGVAWDTEQRRWFHLYPGQGVDFKHPLHWSKPAQNANFMCVECHTTGFKRNFDPATNRFASQWQSLGVGCQACHGPASGHLQWTANRSPVEHRGFVVDLGGKSAITEIETCARCHARRAPLDDGFHAEKRLMDDYLPSTLTRELYALDGKIKDEVFEHGAFMQSKMFDKGVRCSNCHNPHSTALKAPGNAVCLQCHNPAGKAALAGIDDAGLQGKQYDAEEHHHHTVGQAGSQCVDCHMPGKFYMGNDFRHDHGFTLPNPARAIKLGTGDACLGCHQNTPGERVAEQFRYWYGPDKAQPLRYDEGLQQIRNGLPGAAVALRTLLLQNNLPAIRRATLLNELRNYPGDAALKLVLNDLRSTEPQVREVAIHALSAQISPPQRAQYLAPLLDDPVRAVRLAAARDLLAAGNAGLGAWQAQWSSAIKEYEQVQLNLAERAEANLNLALYYQASGRHDQVEPYLRAALLRDPDFLPAVVSLTQWLEGNARATEAARLLSDALQAHPDSALLQHSRGLALIRGGQADDALSALQMAARLEPQNVQYGYVLAVALHDRGQLAQACEVLEKRLQNQPANRDVRLALIQFYQEAGKNDQARQLLVELSAINPDDPVLAEQIR
jgi:predicted CXXCH cytochrome family protein